MGQYVKQLNKKVSFVFFIDDHIYEDWNNLSQAKIKTKRRNKYKQRSGIDAELPEIYSSIMKKYGFSKSNVIRHDHGKPKRRDCLYFSEKILRATGRNVENECAREYLEFLDDNRYFDKTKDYLVSFIPNRCKKNICVFAMDTEVVNVSASHVFIDSMAKVKDNNYFYKIGVSYRKD